MVDSRMNDDGSRRFCQGIRKTCLEGFSYRELFHRDEVVKRFLFKKLDLTAEEMLRWKVVSERLPRLDAAQQAAIGSLQNRVKNCKRLEDRGDKKDRVGSSSSSGGGSGLEGPERKRDRKKLEV